MASSILFMDETFFFHFFSKMLLLIALLFLYLEIEALKLFDAIVSDFFLVVKKVLYTIIYTIVEGGWETCFFFEFKPKDGI